MINAEEVKQQYQRIRFGPDKSVQEHLAQYATGDAVRSYLNSSELRITEQVTPTLNDILCRVTNRLRIPHSIIQCFVFPSSDAQAYSLLGLRDTCVLRFSSALIELLSKDELAFVMGHEIGHFLFSHRISVHGESASLEELMLQRYQEISADRVGLIACGSFEIAAKALIKTISGLSDKHLRFDVATFIHQLRATTQSSAIGATHPSMFIRCRALLWFSLHKGYMAGVFPQRSDELHDIDKNIMNDFKKYVDGWIIDTIAHSKEKLALWLTAERIVQSGLFSKEQQTIFTDMFGVEAMNSMKRYLKSSPPLALKEEVEKRISEATEELMNLIPIGFEDEYQAVAGSVVDRFKR